MDDFQAFISSMQSSRKEADEKVVPMLLSKTKRVEEIFSEIDRLDEFMGVVEQSTKEMELEMQKIDTSVPTGEKKVTSIIGSMLSSFKDRNSTKKKEGLLADDSKPSKGIFKVGDYIS